MNIESRFSANSQWRMFGWGGIFVKREICGNRCWRLQLRWQDTFFGVGNPEILLTDCTETLQLHTVCVDKFEHVWPVRTFLDPWLSTRIHMILSRWYVACSTIKCLWYIGYIIILVCSYVWEQVSREITFKVIVVFLMAHSCQLITISICQNKLLQLSFISRVTSLRA